MNWVQIKQQAELYRRDVVHYPRRWFNEGKSLLATLYPTACVMKTQTYTDIEARDRQDLPADCRYVKRVSSADYPTVDFREFGTDMTTRQIWFATGGTFDVVYLAESDDVAGSDGEIPTLPAPYHYSMAKYIAAKEVEYVRPEWHSQLLSQFYQEAAEVDKSLRRGFVGVPNIPRRRFR